MDKIKAFAKQEVVLVVATILAIISCFFVPISKEYLDYIDFRVLSLLFCLMIIVAGFRYVDFFYILAQKMFSFSRNIRMMVATFIVLCFFGSMLITNDVALILFVPFSIFTLKEQLTKNEFILLIVFETVAANLGSMFTPIGNPQNLYLFSKYSFNLSDFFATMAPYTIFALALLLLCCLFFRSKPVTESINMPTDKKPISYKLHYFCYTAMFMLTILTVARIVPYQATLIICIVVFILINPLLFVRVDYYLLITFIAFFVFVGNLGEIDYFKSLITDITTNNEVVTSIIASQFISNVPAALLLSGFTNNGIGLLIGTNLGGLGTIIASMASLISYKFYSKEKGSSIPTYFLYFTITNFVFLFLLLVLCILLQQL